MKNVITIKKKRTKQIVGSILMVAALSISSHVLADSGHHSKQGAEHSHSPKKHLPKLPPLPKLHKPEKQQSQHYKPKHYNKHHNKHYGKHYNKHHDKHYKKHYKKHHAPTYSERYDWARVVNVVPIHEYHQPSECYEERYYYQENSSNHHGYHDHGPEIAGAIIGGVVGNQFGKGHGKDVATIGGAIIGAAIGHDINKNKNSNAKSMHNQHVTRDVWCEPGYERVVGYDVTYRYHGHTYFRRMDHHPGKRIKIRINVSPSHY